jgi:hypothetical protein
MIQKKNSLLSQLAFWLPASFLFTGCTTMEGKPAPVSWWLVAGLGLVVLGGAIEGLLVIRKLKLRLNQM